MPLDEIPLFPTVIDHQHAFAASVADNRFKDHMPAIVIETHYIASVDVTRRRIGGTHLYERLWVDLEQGRNVVEDGVSFILASFAYESKRIPLEKRILVPGC